MLLDFLWIHDVYSIPTIDEAASILFSSILFRWPAILHLRHIAA